MQMLQPQQDDFYDNFCKIGTGVLGVPYDGVWSAGR
jgi:hypothetical protein